MSKKCCSDDHQHKHDSESQISVQDFLERRSFLSVLIAIGGAVVTGILSVPILRYVFHPVFAKTTEIGWSEVGPSSDFTTLPKPVKKVIHVEQLDGWRKIISEKAIYVSRTAQGELRVLSPICPHLGCPIGWNDDLNQFKCPCHMGTFTPDGTWVSGPPPRGMDGLDTKIANGKLYVKYEYFRSLSPKKEAV